MAIEENKIVRFPEGAQDVPFEEVNYVMVAGPDGKFKRISKNALKAGLTIENGRIQAVDPGPLPTQPAGQTRYMEVTAVGTWTYGGVEVGSNADGYRTTFWWTGDTWVNNGSVRVKGDTPVGTDVLIDEEVPKGKAVIDYTYSKSVIEVKDSLKVSQSDILSGEFNLFFKYELISGKYINNTNGITDGADSLMVKIPIRQIEYHVVATRNAESAFSVAFLDEFGNQLKPEGRSNYTLAFNQEGDFTPPIGAVYFLSNQKVVGSTILNVATSTLYPKSQTEDVKIKEDLIPDNIKYTELLQQSPNLFNKDSGNEVVGYISTSTGDVQTSANSRITEWIELDDAYTHVTIAGRNSTSGNLRFSTNGVSIIKPVKDDGSDFTSFDPSQNGKGINDTFRKPVGAKYVSLTYIFSGNGDADGLMVVNGTEAPDSYQPYGYSTIKPQYLPQSVGDLTLSKDGDNYIVKGLSENNKELRTDFVIRVGADSESNPNFNIKADYANGGSFKNSGDDIAPVNVFDNRYIGGNHGWSFLKQLTLSGHGKTVADVGAIYTDSQSRQFVIVRVPNANTIIVSARNVGTDENPTYPAVNGTLTYVDNGVSTTSISGYTQASINNVWNFIKLNRSVVLIDGKEPQEGDNKGGVVQIVEDYDIFDLDSVLQELIDNRPISGYTDNPNLNSFDADKLFNHSIIYEWKNAGKCTISHSFLAYKKLKFNFHSFIQAGPLTSSSAKLYIPKTLPYGGVDYRLAPTYGTVSSAINFTKSAYWEDVNNAPDRVINFVTGNYGIHLGYIKDVGDSVNRENLVNDAIFLSTSKKLYPKGIDVNTVIEEGTNYSVVAFRNIVDLTDVGAVRTSFDLVEYDNSTYLFLDYHKTGIDAVELPSKYSSKSIEVFEKTDNIELLTKVNTGTIRINSSATSSSYGYIILKLK